MKRSRLLTWVSISLCLSVLLPAVVFASGPQESKKAQDRPIVYEGWLRSWEGVSLVLSTHQGPNTDAYKEMAKEFEKITGAKVTILDESWTDLLSKHLASAAAHDGAYDLLTFFYGWFGHYVEGGLLQDLNLWFARQGIADPSYAMEDFIPAVLEVYGRYKAGFFKDPNALWAVPYKFDVYTAQVFVGLQQYLNMFRDSGFYRSISVTLLYTCIAVAFEIGIGFGLAYVISTTRLRWIRVAFLLPSIATPVVVGLIWRFHLGFDMGTINWFLSSLGLARVNWLGGSAAAQLSVILVDIWQWTPFAMLIFLAGLESLPIDPYEAAVVDGANSWQILRFLTFPLLLPVTAVILLFRTLDAFRPWLPADAAGP